ncbi:MAG: acetyl-CoA carboxylase carboxyltransferase subunit alpha, partial [Dorea sp.]|nr:acetyl-CoA carboxylase carboxyltransferase subunit alpha [Dorea sp.]
GWDRVQLSRMNDRPVGSDYIRELFTDFIEFHGDRYFADDKAVIGGIALFRGMPVTVIAQAKGTNTRENIERNFGMPSPDGYRKALRLMKQAEKFHRPVICFVDTPGAFCGLEAEERGQGEAIARNIYEMSGLRVPVLSVIIGEGGSGGALAMATADEVWMLENSIYSILSPEGFATILWKDSSKAKEAADVMRLTAEDLYRMGIVEEVLAEPSPYTMENLKEVTRVLESKLERFLSRYGKMSCDELTQRRYDRFRKL